MEGITFFDTAEVCGHYVSEAQTNPVDGGIDAQAGLAAGGAARCTCSQRTVRASIQRSRRAGD